MIVSDFMHRKEKRANPLDMLILDPVFKYDLENYVNTYYPDISPKQAREAAENFCGKYAGYKKKYGVVFTENAINQIFF